ncbi:hypothetical protein [Actinoplanes solisilvae]|uniref:hypothetical protein n=1 Tax=Actinoplanes solisilvae TaxID=2486853 RepID=UPI000FDA35EF|nr:hypothetical protein [Actinoplanes solisilvae]
MKEVAVTATGAIIVPAILWLFYSAVRTEWPENYVTASQDFGTVVNRSSIRYLVFRVVPAYLTSLIVATTVSRFHGNGMTAALAGAAIFVYSTQGRHIYDVWRRQHGHRRLPVLVVSLAAGCGIMVASALGGLGPGPFVAVVPPIDEFFKSFWTTILIALIAVAVVGYSRHQTSVTELVRRSREEVGKKLLDFAQETAHKYATDPCLVEAVLLTENLERPKWVRTLERLKSRFVPRGSYGVMQVQANEPLSDESSIEHAIREHLAGCTIERNEYGDYSAQALEDALTSYNRNKNFVSLATSIYSSIYIPIHSDSNEPNTASSEERKQQRIELTAKCYVALTQCLLAGEAGMLAMARLPLSELRSLASIVEQVPHFLSREEAQVITTLGRHLAETGAEVPRPRSTDDADTL